MDMACFHFQQGCKFFQGVFLSVSFLQRVGSLFTAAILGWFTTTHTQRIIGINRAILDARSWRDLEDSYLTSIELDIRARQCGNIKWKNLE